MTLLKRTSFADVFQRSRWFLKIMLLCSSKIIHKTTTVLEPPFFNLQVCRFVSLKRDFVFLNNFSSRMVQWWWCFNAMHYFEQALGLQLYMKETLTPVFSCQFCEIVKIQKYKNYLRALLFCHRSSFHNLARVQNLAWFKTWRWSKFYFRRDVYANTLIIFQVLTD